MESLVLQFLESLFLFVFLFGSIPVAKYEVLTLIAFYLLLDLISVPSRKHVLWILTPQFQRLHHHFGTLCMNSLCPAKILHKDKSGFTFSCEISQVII